jgi:PAS domain S-box-containing protein
MTEAVPRGEQWTKRPSAETLSLVDSEAMFELLFNRSADAIWVLDPAEGVFVDCNQAAVELLHARTKEQLLGTRPGDLSPIVQPDGVDSHAKAVTILKQVEKEGTQRFEWLGRRLDGGEVPLEVTATTIHSQGRRLHVVVSRDITARKKAESDILELNQNLERRISERTAELSASAAQLRTLIEHAPEAIVVFGGDTGRFTACNENACRLYGLTREQLLRLAPEDVSPEFQPDGRPSAMVAEAKIRAALAGEIPIFEWIHRHADGHQIPCEVRLVRLPGDGPPLIRASIIDNTDRKRREKVQQATFAISEAVHTTDDLADLYHRLHLIVAGLMPAQNFYIALLTPGGDEIEFAYHVDERTPKPPSQPLNTGLTSVVLRSGRALLVGPEMEPRKKQVGPEVVFEGLEDSSYIESGKPAAIWLGVPLTVHSRTFGVVAVQDYSNAQAYGEQEKQILTFVAGQIALAIDRKRAEQARRESEAKYRVLFEASSQGVILHDEEKMLEVNPACLRILGFSSADEIVGKHPADTSAPVQLNGERADVLARRYIRECSERGNARFEWLARNGKGEVKPIEIVLTRVEWGGRQLFQAVFNDISERKRTEAELLRTLAREKELNQLKSNFVSMVSHEFRTPLGIIQSSAEILRDYYQQLTPNERAEQLGSIIQNTRRMAEMMDEVMVLSRLDTGRMDFRPAPIDLGLFCRRVAEEVQSATDRGRTIELEIDASLPLALADERLLEHIFTNLLNNAVKYSHPQGSIRFTAQRAGANLVCHIQDHGIGIPAEDIPWLFQAFQRGANVGERPGTGLGLVLVKRCVDLHHGKVQIQSKLGEGTTVTITLPVFESRL